MHKQDSWEKKKLSGQININQVKDTEVSLYFLQVKQTNIFNSQM